MRFVLSNLGRPRKLRATDADRDAYSNIVSKAYSEGQLDATTFEYRSTKVLNAKTIGELEDLVADLVTPETALSLADKPVTDVLSTVAGPMVKKQLKIVGATTLGFIALSGLIAAGAISAATESTSIQPEFPGVDIEIPPIEWAPEATIDMYSADGLQQVVDDIVAAAGPRLTWLGLYGEYAIASGPGASGATRMADYDWRDGDVSKSPSPLDLEEEELFDITEDVDLAAVAALASDAARLTGVIDPVSVYVSINRDISTADRNVEFRVTLSNDYQDGYIHADHLGEIINMEGPDVEPDTTRFFNAENAARAIEAVRTRLGHDEVTELRFYGEYVAAEAPPEAGAEVVDSYEYRGGSIASKETYTPFQPDDVRAAVFSLTDVDGSVVAQVIASSPIDAGIEGSEVSYAYVQRPRRPAGHDAVIVVLVYTPYESIEVIYSLTGELLQVG